MHTRPFVAVALTSIVAFSCVSSSSTPPRDAGVFDTVTITVTDSSNAKASTTMTVTAG